MDDAPTTFFFAEKFISTAKIRGLSAAHGIDHRKYAVPLNCTNVHNGVC